MMVVSMMLDFNENEIALCAAILPGTLQRAIYVQAYICFFMDEVIVLIAGDHFHAANDDL